MRIGFSGTREGMTQSQRDTLSTWFARNRVDEFHHGSAVGADEQAVRVLLDLADVFDHVRRCAVHSHPCDLPQQGSPSAFILSHVKHKPRKPLLRNHDIVDATELLVAAPKGPEEVRSGTWASIRYARKLGRMIVIVWPDGRITTVAAHTEPLEGVLR